MMREAMERAAAVSAAADYLASVSKHPSPVVPYLQKRFGLTAVEACKATKEAALRRARAT